VVGQQTYWIPNTVPLAGQQSSPVPYQQSSPVTYSVETAEGLRQQQILSMAKYLEGNEVGQPTQPTQPGLVAGAPIYRVSPALGTVVPVTSLPLATARP